MSIISATSGEDRYPRVRFQSVGDAVAGRIISTEDYQETEFADDQARGVKKGDPKFFPSGDPVMGVRIVLETSPGDESSRVTLWAQGKRMLSSIAKAVHSQGARDLEEGADLAVTHTGYEGRAKAYQAAYARAADAGEREAA